MPKFSVNAVRYYFSAITFEVEASDWRTAQAEAERMIDDNEVEFSSIDSCDEPDVIEVYEVKA